MICKYFLPGDSEIHPWLKTTGLNGRDESRIGVNTQDMKKGQGTFAISISFKNPRQGFQITSTEIENILVKIPYNQKKKIT